MMHHYLFLSLTVHLSFVNAIPGIEFGDNQAKKYFTEDNGLAELTFKESMSKLSTIRFFRKEYYKNKF